jgi:hypothetical protein
MIERLKDLIAQNFFKKEIEKKNNTLLKSRKEVEINGNGTSGYTIKEGVNKGTVVGHIKRETSNIENKKNVDNSHKTNSYDELDY